MPPWTARLADARDFARADHRESARDFACADHRAVFARFVEALAARFRASGHPRVREV